MVDSRESREGDSIRRRRECLGCGRRFTSYERLEEVPILIVKKDGRREPFDRQKLLRGIMSACQKRPVSLGTLEEAAGDIQAKLMELTDREVPSRNLGELVMDALKRIDSVAYVRFASVYRDFKDLPDFVRALESLMPGTPPLLSRPSSRPSAPVPAPVQSWAGGGKAGHAGARGAGAGRAGPPRPRPAGPDPPGRRAGAAPPRPSSPSSPPRCSLASTPIAPLRPSAGRPVDTHPARLTGTPVSRSGIRIAHLAPSPGWCRAQATVNAASGATVASTVGAFRHPCARAGHKQP